MKNAKTFVVVIVAVLFLLAAMPVHAVRVPIYQADFESLNGFDGDTGSGQWASDSNNNCGSGLEKSAHARNTDGELRLNKTNMDTRGWQNIWLNYTARTIGLDSGEYLNVITFVNGSSILLASHTTNFGCANFGYSLDSSASETPFFSVQFICNNNLISEHCIVDNLNATGIPARFSWNQTTVSTGTVEAGSFVSSGATAVAISANHTGASIAVVSGNGTSFISSNTTAFAPADAVEGKTVDVSWSCAPSFYQGGGLYEATFRINSAQNQTGETISVQCNVTPYVNVVPQVVINNATNTTVAFSNPIVYVTATDNRQSSLYVEIIANGANVSYGLQQNDSATARQFSSLADGIYSYFARAYDNFSNAVNSENLTILIDTTKPTISNSSAMRINQTVNNNTWTANFTVTDNFYLESIAIEINGTNYAPTQQGSYFTYSANLSLGNHTVNVYANDSAGNSESMLNGWVFYFLPPEEPQASPPFGESTKPGLLDSLFGSQPATTPTATEQPQPSATPTPAPTAPINPSPTPSPTPTGGTAPAITENAPTGAAVATGTGNEVQGDTVTGFVTLLRNVVTLTAVLLIGAMLGLLLWINSRRQVSF